MAGGASRGPAPISRPVYPLLAGIAGPQHEEGPVRVAIVLAGGTRHPRIEHIGAIGRGPVRVKSFEAMLDALEETPEQA